MGVCVWGGGGGGGGGGMGSNSPLSQTFHPLPVNFIGMFQFLPVGSCHFSLACSNSLSVCTRPITISARLHAHVHGRYMTCMWKAWGHTSSTHSSRTFLSSPNMFLLLEYHLYQLTNSLIPSLRETVGSNPSTLLVSEISAYVLWRSEGGSGSKS